MKKEWMSINRSLNYEPNHIYVIMHIATNFGLLYISINFLLSESPIQILLSQILLPIFFFRCFSGMHDAVHGTLVKSKFFNNLLGIFYGAGCFLPFSTWKAIHLVHHQWTGNLDKDPVMRIVKDFRPNNGKKQNLLNFMWKNWIPILSFGQHLVFWHEGLKQIVKSSRKSIANFIEVSMSYLVPLSFYIAAVSLIPFNKLLLVPVSIFLYLLLAEVINLPHHLRLNQFGGDKKLSLYEQYSSCRSCHYPKWFSSFVLNNFNLHTEHHLFPQLPWYRLQNVSSKVEELCGANYNKSIANDWIIEKRKSKLDDIILRTDYEQILSKINSTNSSDVPSREKNSQNFTNLSNLNNQINKQKSDNSLEAQ